mmetsp:Transcript_14629/g.47998  ORF Transcript_14629/g.47998 Transcript_14629/m.47998 type:complete len:234 (+) Transcript_14629:224-925(+)
MLAEMPRCKAPMTAARWSAELHVTPAPAADPMELSTSEHAMASEAVTAPMAAYITILRTTHIARSEKVKSPGWNMWDGLSRFCLLAAAPSDSPRKGLVGAKNHTSNTSLIAAVIIWQSTASAAAGPQSHGRPRDRAFTTTVITSSSDTSAPSLKPKDGSAFVRRRSPLSTGAKNPLAGDGPACCRSTASDRNSSVTAKDGSESSSTPSSRLTLTPRASASSSSARHNASLGPA